MCAARGDFERYFAEELRRLRTDHIDYYLMHMLTDVESWRKLEAAGVRQWLAEKKAAGQIGQAGFSFHGSTAMFERLLDCYDWDFCQIQYNYMDENSQAGRAGLQAAAARGLPVIIMEPLRGGKLVTLLPEGARRLFAASPRGWTPAEWALRWLWDQPEVTCVLSGMNSVEMVEENCRIADAVRPHTMQQSDFALLEQVKTEIARGVKAPLHRLRLLHALPQGRRYPRRVPLLQRDVHREKGHRPPRILAGRLAAAGTGLCDPVRRLRPLRAALPAAPAHPRAAQTGRQSPAPLALPPGRLGLPQVPFQRGEGERGKLGMRN